MLVPGIWPKTGRCLWLSVPDLQGESFLLYSWRGDPLFELPVSPLGTPTSQTPFLGPSSPSAARKSDS